MAASSALAAISEPPATWQKDLSVFAGYDGRAPGHGYGGSRFQGPDVISEAYRHLRQVVADARRESDLYDLLSNVRREETYQAYVAGWPSLLRPISPSLLDLPAMVQDKYRGCQAMCFCGLFPEIQRAWASVDNSLFLWRYDKSGDVPIEYCGEEQAICAVGLLKPKAGVFMEAIQHVIVLCTTIEIVMLGVCPLRRGGAAGADPLLDLTLQPLPMYTVPSDNIVMTCVVGTVQGRAFLGGSDGHVYELQYQAADSWRQKRIAKVRVTGGLQQFLPSFLPGLLGLGGASAIDRLAIDDERHILYSLNQASAIQVFDLGASGNEPARKVCDVNDFYAEAQGAVNGREVFRGGPAADKKGATVKHISSVAVAESSKLHLVAVTADGRRVYFTTQDIRRYRYGSSGSGSLIGSTAGVGSNGLGSGAAIESNEQDAAALRPTMLQAVYCRAALPLAGGLPGRGMGADLGRMTTGEVVAARYCDGTLVLSEAAGPDGRTTRLQLAARNATAPPSALNTGGSAGSGAGLREFVAEHDTFVPGETCALEATPSACLLGAEAARGSSDELYTQLFWPAQRFALISTAGVLELQKRRPVDVLQVILEERSSEKLRSFFEAYGAPEAAAMCYIVATSRAAGSSISAVAAREAAAALEDPLLVGEACMPEDLAMSGIDAGNGANTSRGIFMGRAVNPNPEPTWSANHRGLCLLLARLLQPVWEQRVVSDGSKAAAAGGSRGMGASAASLLHLRLSAQTCEVLESKLRGLAGHVADFLSRRRANGYVRHAPVNTAAGAGGRGGPATGSYSLLGVPLQQPSGGYGGGFGSNLGLNMGPGMGGGYNDYMDPRGGEGAVVAQAAKRQRLMHAAQLEDERTARVGALASKTAEALALVRILSNRNFARICTRLNEGSRTTLKGMALRDLVCDPQGETIATQLISVMVTEALESNGPGAGGLGAVEIVAAGLRDRCPSYFKDEDRTFYQASAKLKQAEAATSPAERSALTAEAVSMLRLVPLACNLEYLVTQLAFLRHYQGIVELPLLAAAANDPENLAMRPDLGGDCQRARVRREACYSHILSTLRALTDPAGPGTIAAAAAKAGGGGGGGAQKDKGLSMDERKQYRQTLLKACVASSDLYFHSVLYTALIDMGAADELLTLGSSHLEDFLTREGGLAPSTTALASSTSSSALVPAARAGAVQGLDPGGTLQPLSRRQVTLLELLAKMRISQRRFAQAAEVYAALGARRSGSSSDTSVSLSERVSWLQAAVLQAKSAGDSSSVTTYQQMASLAVLQRDIGEALQARKAAAAAAKSSAAAAPSTSAAPPRSATATEDPAALERQLSDLSHGLADVSALYNDFAQPLRLWGVCLRIIDFAGGPVDARVVTQLWDHYVLQAWEEQKRHGPAAQLFEVCLRTEQLGAELYPNTSSFPLPHVALRLEQLAAGVWPSSSSSTSAPSTSAASNTASSSGGDAVTRALRSACGGAVPPVLRTYEALLSRRAVGSAADAELTHPRLRLQLLRSMAHLCRAALREAASAGPSGGIAALGNGQAGTGSSFGNALGPAGRAREAGALLDACERFELEAGRLGMSEAQELVSEFADIKRQAESSLH